VDPKPMSAERDRNWAAVVSRLPGDASLSATSFAAAQLSHRRDLYIFPKLGEVQWVLIDRGERIGLTRDARDALQALRVDPGWVLVAEQGRISLYRRVSPPAPQAG
jgi:hypothetical protein